MKTDPGIFLCSQGPEFGPISNGIKVTTFIPNFEKNSQSSKKKFFFVFFFWKIGIFIQSTHTSYMVTFSFNLMAIVCVIANLYFY